MTEGPSPGSARAPLGSVIYACLAAKIRSSRADYGRLRAMTMRWTWLVPS